MTLGVAGITETRCIAGVLIKWLQHLVRQCTRCTYFKITHWAAIFSPLCNCI